MNDKDHWSDLMPRLRLQGIDPSATYCVTEPLPNDLMRMAGTLQVVPTNTPKYQLGTPSCKLSGAALVNMGLPVTFFSEDDAVCFRLEMERMNTGSRLSRSGLPHAPRSDFFDTAEGPIEM